MPALKLTIGALSMQTDCTVPTIRYYEQIGLLPSPQRDSNGHRYYREGDLKRLAFIRRCRDFGFPIHQVRGLAALFEDGDRPCVEVRDLAQVHLDQVRARLAEMRQLEKSLAAFVSSCDTACSDGQTKDCVIIGSMASPGTGSTKCGAIDSGSEPSPQFVATEIQPNR
jgi:DNA-binding transcriptional MerR regulator